MQEYVCILYETAGGKKPVEEFIESLEPQLRHPHTDYIGEGIFELRFKGKEGQIRVLFFFFHGKKIIFTNGFLKKTQKTPQKEIEIAQERKKDFLMRNN